MSGQQPVHLDTHVVIWLHTGELHHIPPPALTVIRSSQVSVSPMVLLELDVLHEIGRANSSAAELCRTLADSIDLRVSATAFAQVAAAATNLTWTRDPFDRLICAQAIADDVRLLTRDRLIRKHLDRALWDDDPSPGAGGIDH